MHERSATLWKKVLAWLETMAEWIAWGAGHPVTMAGVLLLTLVWLGWGVARRFDEVWLDWGTTTMTWPTLFLLFPVLWKQNKAEARIVAHVEEIAEDIDEVDDQRARERAEEDCR